MVKMMKHSQKQDNLEREQKEIAQIIMEEWSNVLQTLTENSLDPEVIEAVQKQFNKPLERERDND